MAYVDHQAFGQPVLGLVIGISERHGIELGSAGLQQALPGGVGVVHTEADMLEARRVRLAAHARGKQRDVDVAVGEIDRSVIPPLHQRKIEHLLKERRRCLDVFASDCDVPNLCHLPSSKLDALLHASTGTFDDRSIDSSCTRSIDPA
jgi:hypothetical protein